MEVGTEPSSVAGAVCGLCVQVHGWHTLLSFGHFQGPHGLAWLFKSRAHGKTDVGHWGQLVTMGLLGNKQQLSRKAQSPYL